MPLQSNNDVDLLTLYEKTKGDDSKCEQEIGRLSLQQAKCLLKQVIDVDVDNKQELEQLDTLRCRGQWKLGVYETFLLNQFQHVKYDYANILRIVKNRILLGD